MLMAAQDEHNRNRRELTEEKEYDRDEPGAHIGAKHSTREQREKTRHAGDNAEGKEN